MGPYESPCILLTDTDDEPVVSVAMCRFVERYLCYEYDTVESLWLCRKDVGVDANRSSGLFVYQAARPSVPSMKRACSTMSPFTSQRIWPFRMMFMASYPAIVLSAPSTDRNHWLATTRFLTKR